MAILENCITGRRSGKTFILAERIGEGTSGVVHRAIGEDNNNYALKLPNRADTPQRADGTKNLIREAEIQESFNHPYITPIVLFDMTISKESDPFLVTPLADSDLNSYIKREIIIAPEKAQIVSMQVAEALQVVHGEEFTHGDVKTENVLLQRIAGNITAQLTDFGSSLPIGAYETDPVLATEIYAAPERFDGVVSPAVDQYAWAAGIVYPSFTGEAPSDPNEYDPILDIYGYPRSMESIIGAQNMTPIHGVFQEVASIALKEFPSERYSSMVELLDDLKMKLAKSNELQQKDKKYLF